MALKILHFIPNPTEVSEQLQFLPHVLHQMEKSADVHMVSLSEFNEEYLHTHFIPTTQIGGKNHGFVNLLAFHKRYVILLYRLMPDIVHIHGSYNYLNSRIELWSRKRGFPVVFSPYGGMNPEYIDAEYGMRTWKMILYQKEMTRHASAIQVCDEEEGQYILNEGISRRVSFIEVPADRETSQYQEYADQLVALYHQVLNTESSRHLDINCQEAVSALLHLSMAKETERQPLCAEDILNLRSLSPTQWRKVLLFAREQGVYGQIAEGALRMQLSNAHTDLEDVPRFTPLYPKSKNNLAADVIMSDSKRLLSKLDATVSRQNAAIRSICIMLLNIRWHLSNRSLSLRHLCDFYEALRNLDCDEYQLQQAMSRLGLTKLCGRVCQVLSEVAYLGEGFMPTEAIDDSGTEKIRQRLVNYN